MNPNLVLDLVEYCAIAYDGAPSRSFALEDGQARPRGFAHRFPDFGIVAFAGSESILDWLTDFQCIQKRYEDGAVHRGFLDEFGKVWPQITRIFRGIPAGYKIQVTGHSLGGALSMLAAREFSKMFGCDVTHVSFGCPRVFDPTLANEFNRLVPNSVRIQHHDDLVPRVPKVNYRHAGRLIRIDDNGKEIKFSGILGTIERWFEIAKADLTLSAETDHLIKNYVPAVQNLRNRKLSKGGVL
jgi:hypothetical protein